MSCHHFSCVIAAQCLEQCREQKQCLTSIFEMEERELLNLSHSLAARHWKKQLNVASLSFLFGNVEDKTVHILEMEKGLNLSCRDCYQGWRREGEALYTGRRSCAGVGVSREQLPQCRQEAYPPQKQHSPPPPAGGDVFLRSQVTGLHPQRLGEETVPCREGYWEERGTSMEVGLILRRDEG